MAQGFVTAMSQFFGKKGTLADFNAELKSLSPSDKQFFAQELRKVGIDCDDPK